MVRADLPDFQYLLAINLKGLCRSSPQDMNVLAMWYVVGV